MFDEDMLKESIEFGQKLGFSSRKVRRLYEKFKKDNPSVDFSSSFTTEDGMSKSSEAENARMSKFSLYIHAGLASRWLSLKHFEKFKAFVSKYSKDVEAQIKRRKLGDFYNQNSGDYNQYEVVFACLTLGIDAMFYPEKHEWVVDLADILVEIFPKFQKMDPYEYFKQFANDRYCPIKGPVSANIDDMYVSEVFAYIVSLFRTDLDDEFPLYSGELMHMAMYVANKLNMLFVMPRISELYKEPVLEAVPYCENKDFKNVKNVEDLVIKYLEKVSESENRRCDQNEDLAGVLDCMLSAMEVTGATFDVTLSKETRNYLVKTWSYENDFKDEDRIDLLTTIILIFGAVCDELKKEREFAKFGSSLSISENRDDSEEISNLKSKVEELEKDIIAKQSAISRRDEKIAKIEDAEKKAAHLEKENKKLLEELEKIKAEKDEIERIENDERSDEEVAKVLSSLLGDNSVFFGGHESLTNKLKKLMPSVRFVSCDTVSTLDNVVKNAKYVIVKADHIGHKQMYKIKSMLERSNAKLIYSPNSTNVSIITKGVLSKIEDIEVEADRS